MARLKFLHVDDETEAAPGEFYKLPTDSDSYLRVRPEWPAKATMIVHDCSVAGVSRDGRDLALTRWMLGKNRSLELRRDTRNRHDKHAVEVYARWTGWLFPNRVMIGYIPKSESKDVASAMAKHHVQAWPKTVFPATEPGRSPGLRMKIGYVG